MAIKYPEDRKRFIDDLRAAGLPAGRASSLELAELLGFSVSHIQNLFCGANRYGSTTKDKIDALIAAKANGPEPGPSSDQSAVFYGDAVAHYQIQEMPRGMFKVVCVAAMTHDHAIASAICDMLNKEGG